MTSVINLIGGSGVGKSTVAAEIYVKLKREVRNVELVREVAKDWAWEGKKIGLFDQVAIIGEQLRKEAVMFNKVDIVVTDSPVVLGGFYLEHNHGQTFMNKPIKEYYEISIGNGIQFYNFVLKRTTKFNPDGRYENEKEALLVDKHLMEYMGALGYPYIEVDCCIDGSADFITSILGGIL
jgi:hypothetical protein